MVEVIDIRESTSPVEAIGRAAGALQDGQLVVLPCEAGYHLAASLTTPGATRRLLESGDGGPTGRPVVMVDSQESALAAAGELSAVALRLTGRCWPGPVSLDLPAAAPLPSQWDEPARAAIAADGRLLVRQPGLEELHQVLAQLGHPAWCLPLSETETRAVREGDDPRVGLALDAGPPRFADGVSVVRVVESDWEMLSEGVVGRETIARLACRAVVFVCTGNTCRSPMAEAMFRKLLAERLQCSQEQLVERGFLIASAGVAAFGGSPISPEAAESLKDRGIDSTSHVSQPLTGDLAAQADHVITMTRGHRDSILGLWPEAAERVQLLASDATDIEDPIGGSSDVYLDCCNTIHRHLQLLLEQVLA